MNQQPIERGLRELAELAGPHQIDPNALGRRIRRRRHTRLAVISVAAMAIVATCGWLLPNLASGDRAATPAGPVSPTGSDLQRSTPKPTPVKLGAEAQQVADLFERVLPPGKVRILGAQGLHDKGLPSPVGSGLFEPAAAAEYDDGHGEALVNVAMTRWDNPDKAKSPFTCAVGQGELKPDHCQTERLPGGGVFNLSKIDAKKDAWNAEWTATYAAPDGARVVIEEENAPGDKGVAPTRDEPPFDAAQLKQMVTSPLWHEQLAAIPAAGSQSRETNTPFGPDGMGAIFYRLIPADFARSGFAGAHSPVFGNTMVLTDAQGKGSVYAGEDSGGGTSDAGHTAKFRQDYPNATRLPNGDWLGTKKVAGKGGTGTEQYWVAVLHSHSRVELVALNSVGVNGPRTRATPVLSIDQLTVIADSPTWGEAK
jgi:hypothetical protein